MPLIPMKQEITVRRGGELDDWGNEMPAEEFTLNCRIAEGSQIIASASGIHTVRETEVARARILLDQLADIRYTDEISFTNELGETITKRPKEISVKRMLSGKPVMTEVFI